MAAGRAPYRSRIILILLVLVSLPCSAALTDFERITKIGAEWGIASYWPGVCPGNCNSSPPWPGLQWQGTNLTRLQFNGDDNSPYSYIRILNSVMPADLCDFPALTHLALRNQNLPCLDTSLLKLNTSVTFLDFKGSFVGRNCVLPNLSTLTRLATLEVRLNNLTGTWPRELETMTTLTSLLLDNNLFPLPITLNLTGIIQNLRRLYLGNSYPATVSERTQYPSIYSTGVQMLELSMQGIFNGVFACPTSPNLAVLEAGYNDFAGQPFPTCMAQSPGCKLTDFSVPKSGFSGATDDFSISTDFVVIGPFPIELSNCTALDSLRLSGNDLQNTGLPKEISKFTSLIGLYIENSPNFVSTIPTELGLLSKMRFIALNTNPGLTGTLPTELAKLTQLKNLNVQSTNIRGTLPQEYALLRNLVYLDLDNTSLTGDVPGWIFTMAPGAYVDLEHLPNLTNCSFPGMRTRVVPAGTDPPTLLADIGLTIEIERPVRLCDPYEAVCFNYTWFVPASNVTYVLPTNATVNVTSPVVIGGDFTQPTGAVIQITTSGTDASSFVTVNGTAQISGTLVIQLTQSSPSVTVPVLSAGTLVGNFTSVVVPQTYNGCAYVSSQSTASGTLSVLLSVDTKCAAGSGPGSGPGTTTGSGGGSTSSSTIIIAASVAGAIVLIAIVIVVILIAMKRTRGHWLWNQAADENVLTM